MPRSGCAVAMLDEVRRAAHDTRTARRKRAAFDASALASLRGTLGREPSRAELARAAGRRWGIPNFFCWPSEKAPALR